MRRGGVVSWVDLAAGRLTLAGDSTYTADVNVYVQRPERIVVTERKGDLS